MKRTLDWKVGNKGSEAYERYIVPAWMGEWAEALVAIGGVESGQRVLDVACGTGIVARKAARLVGSSGRVDGLDAIKEMLNAARQCAERGGMQAIGWHQGDASRMPFDSEEYDVVLCQQGLQFFSDRPAALREMSRVLVPGGRLAISVWRSLDRCPFLAVLADAVGSYLGADAAALIHASCSLADREELRTLLNNAGLRGIHIRLEVRVARYSPFSEFLPGYLSVLPIFPAIAAMPDQDRVDMIQRIVASLHNYMDDGGFAAPMESHVVTANKG